jgi:hypothetical protein
MMIIINFDMTLAVFHVLSYSYSKQLYFRVCEKKVPAMSEGDKWAVFIIDKLVKELWPVSVAAVL